MGDYFLAEGYIMLDNENYYAIGRSEIQQGTGASFKF